MLCLLTLAALCLMWLVSCQRPPQALSLLIITLDTTRADHLGAYGYAAAQTPNLDRLAMEGTLYEWAYSAAPETLPSHATMFTGLYPPSHGVRLNLDYRLPPEATTLARMLSERGMQTGAIVAASVLDRRYGLDQGFDVYREPPGGRGMVELSAEKITERALETASSFGSKPYFLWVHYFDPHNPFQPQPPFEVPPDAVPESVELYDLEIASMDHWIGVLLDGLEEEGQLEHTVIIVVADHGESLGEHGETYHTLFVYDATQHVPLIIAGPRVPAMQRIATPVSTVDIFATALSLLGAEVPSGTSSRVLPGLDLQTSSESDRPRVLYSESMAPALRFGWSALQAVRVPGWLYVRAPREELYDLHADPRQLVDLSRTHEDRVVQMRRLLARTLREMPTTGYGEAASRRATRHELQELEALGYLGSRDLGARGVELELEGEDPKDMVEVYEAFQLAHLARRLGHKETEEELLRFVVSVDRNNPAGWQHYGEALLSQRRFEEARSALTRALELRPSADEVRLLLATAAQELGDADAAAGYLQEALASSSFPGEIWRATAELRVWSKDWQGAAEAYRKTLEYEPDDERATLALHRLEARGLATPESM